VLIPPLGLIDMGPSGRPGGSFHVREADPGRARPAPRLPARPATGRGGPARNRPRTPPRRSRRPHGGITGRSRCGPDLFQGGMVLIRLLADHGFFSVNTSFLAITSRFFRAFSIVFLNISRRNFMSWPHRGQVTLSVDCSRPIWSRNTSPHSAHVTGQRSESLSMAVAHGPAGCPVQCRPCVHPRPPVDNGQILDKGLGGFV